MASASVLVDGELVFPAHLHHPVNVPALIQVGQPLAGVFGHLLVAVDAGRCQREVQDVGGEPVPCFRVGGAQAAVMGLRARHDVLDVGVPHAVEPGPRVGAVDPALGINDPRLN